MRDKLEDYEKDMPRENFAEGFARYYHNERSKSQLQQDLPRLYDFLRRLEQEQYRPAA